MENPKKDKNAKKEKNSISYEAIWKSIIRPPKDEYTIEELGPKSFLLNKKNYTRKDYDIVGCKGKILKCSFYEMDEIDRETISLPVIVYLHGNSSSRVESLKYLRMILVRNINLFCFDFSGCGKSEGDYISLGYYEKEDLRIIIDFIYKLPNVGKIGLWGHSMGAATAALYTPTDFRISCCCLDSSFYDFIVLAKEIVERSIHIPNFIFSSAISIIRKTIIKKNGLDIYNLKPIEKIKEIKVPIYFIHGIKDKLIDMTHSVKLFENCNSCKKLINFFEGGHNTFRPKEIVEKICDFFKMYLNNEKNEI